MLTTETRAQSLGTLRKLTHILDEAIAIPGSKYRVGLDPILGLFPGFGDVLGLLLSSYLVVEAVRWKVPASTLGRMVFNIALEWLVGNVPVLGDIFDVAWKANVKNLALLESHAEQPSGAQAADQRFVFLIFMVLGLLVALAGTVAGTVFWLTVQVVRAIIGG